jgi:transcriptional regulator of heat shock response
MPRPYTTPASLRPYHFRSVYKETTIPMAKVQVVSQVDLNVVLDSVVQLDIRELEQFAAALNRVLVQRKVPSLPQREAELLQQINRGLPTPVKHRYAELSAMLADETLTAQEHQELLTLIDQVELANVERIKHLIALAQLRGVDLDILLDQLGIQPPVHA